MQTIDDAQNKQNEHALNAKLIGFEDRFAVLELDHNLDAKSKVVYWPIANLPQDIQVGDTIELSTNSDGNKQEEREKLARELFKQMVT